MFGILLSIDVERAGEKEINAKNGWRNFLQKHI